VKGALQGDDISMSLSVVFALPEASCLTSCCYTTRAKRPLATMCASCGRLHGHWSAVYTTFC